jgi:exodeoxyribonuclease VII large subunit
MINQSAIFSVSEASRLIKGVMEQTFSDIRIRGELSQIKRAESGHTYMTIKDADAAISAIIWRATPIPMRLEEGMEVVATGRITTYPARSNYQIIVANIELAGVGALLKMLEDRKQKLAAEGLFDAARKKPIPPFPETIGIITSPTGAAIRDILNRLKTRTPKRIIIYPTLVQGDTAATEIVRGIDFFNKVPFAGEGVDGAAGRGSGKISRPDVLIIARGGGSLEDLLPFSEESVVRAVAASGIPIISGVGHEPDFMLIDFAADLRAPTPTAAAEMVAREREVLMREIEARRLTNPRQMIAEKFQRLDDISRHLTAAFQRKIFIGRQSILGQSLQSPSARVAAERSRIGNLATRMSTAAKTHMDKIRTALDYKSETLETLSYMKTLRRGFAIVKSGEKIISSAAKWQTPAEIIFYDGSVKI